MNGIQQDNKLGVLFLGRTRPGFDPEWGKEVKRGIRSFLEDSDYPYFIPSENIPNDEELRRAIYSCRAEGVQTLIVTQPTVSDGRLAPILAQLWDQPFVLWATPEKQSGAMISSNSLVGTHIFASTLRQLHHRFEFVYGGPESKETREDLETAVGVIAAVTGLKQAKIGLIGSHAPGFINLAADPALISATFGAQLYHQSIPEFLQRFEAVAEEEVSGDTAEFAELGIPLREVRAEDLAVSSRYYLAFKQLMNGENLAALAVRCWPELPNATGQWPYVALSRLLSEGKAVVQEGDVDGAIGMLAARRMGMGSVYLSDWLEHDRSTIAIWHTGSIPFDFCEPIGSELGPHIAKQFNIKNPAVIEATLKSDLPVTVFRVWRCDNLYHCTALEGVTVRPKRHLLGNNGLARFEEVNIEEWFDRMIHQGLPHHPLVARGSHKHRLRRFCRQIGIQWID
ncbi:MAG: sugar isomerase [Spirochaetaceae bacterium]|nr:MAG: sugar isomerase [Spirochaetaceae bacterium]